jgi:hypothetical protein
VVDPAVRAGVREVFGERYRFSLVFAKAQLPAFAGVRLVDWVERDEVRQVANPESRQDSEAPGWAISVDCCLTRSFASRLHQTPASVTCTVTIQGRSEFPAEMHPAGQRSSSEVAVPETPRREGPGNRWLGVTVEAIMSA